MKCCCLLTVLERAVKKLLYKMSVMRLMHIEEEHQWVHMSTSLQQGCLTFSILCAQPLLVCLLLLLVLLLTPFSISSILGSWVFLFKFQHFVVLETCVFKWVCCTSCVVYCIRVAKCIRRGGTALQPQNVL